MIQSMTAFASREGAQGALAWAWDLRGVNARGLDLRLRLPDGMNGLEALVRAALTRRLGRGSIALSLRLTRTDAAAGIGIDPAALEHVLQALQQVQERAANLGVALAPPTAAEVLTTRGVMVQSTEEAPDDPNIFKILSDDLEVLLEDFIVMRRAEGTTLAMVLVGQLDRIADLITRAAAAAVDRLPESRAALDAALRRVVEAAPGIERDRIAQELALIAVKADVTEEIDRLRAHVATARALLSEVKPVGRRLDFLTQEFNREANTLCSKAQSATLAAIGLDLKAVIDQMHEQVQNVE